jgi:hypothetical protein
VAPSNKQMALMLWFDEVTKQQKKAYRLRYGNFQKAWNFVEAHIKVAVEG